MSHPYKEILIAIANGEIVQWENGNGHWVEDDTILTTISYKSYPPERYRVKPKTIRIGRFEVPEPMKIAPDGGTRYWYVSVGSVSQPASTWYGSKIDKARLESGIMHRAKADAEAHKRALLSFTTGQP